MDKRIKCFEIVTEQDKAKKDFYDAVINHQEPECPKCHLGKIVCPQGKIKKPHSFCCTNNCGWIMNIDYDDCIVE